MSNLTNEIALDTLAAEIRAEHDAAQHAAETATKHAIRCGLLLIEAKDGLTHGQWLPWLQKHCALSERTGQAYMRLARKHGELNAKKAQRVADLPVRDAMKEIADQRVENPVPVTPFRCAPPRAERVWEWAEKRVVGPFNMFDFDNLNMMSSKLMRQTGVPAVAAFCISTATEETPMLRLVSNDDLHEATRCLVPVAKGQFRGCDGLDIDLDDLGRDLRFFLGMLELTAQRTIGGILNEFAYRREAYKDTASEDYAAQYDHDFKRVRGAFLENCDAQLAELGSAAHE